MIGARRHALVPTTAADIYTQRYKGIWICLTILTRALVGNYVNFGVFGLYGDPGGCSRDSVGTTTVAKPVNDNRVP